MSKKLIIGLLVAIVFVVGGVSILVKKIPGSEEVKNPVPAVVKDLKSYKMSDVAMHKTPTDCWTTVNGGVYDLTPFINQHPGGSQAILSLCGIDGSSAFNGQHGGQKRPANELSSLQISNLVK